MGKKRVAAFDILRITAAAMVLGVHAGQMGNIDHITYVGQYGVQLFFILSGYLSEASLARESAPIPYYKKRILRILPLYWLAVVLRWLVDLLFTFHSIPFGERIAAGGPCGWKYLRYFPFLQMWLPSEDWSLWNNRNVFWTMSAFAFFYLAAPWLYRFLNGFWRSFGFLAVCIAGKGILGKTLNRCLANWPASANIGEFSAKMPLMVLYCFLLGTTLYHAIEENKQWLYGSFCILLPALFGFQRFSYEGVFTAWMMLLLQVPQPELGSRSERVLIFLSDGSFWLYLFHPIVLTFLPVCPGGKASAVYALFVWGLAAILSYVCYAAAIRPLEKMIVKQKITVS